MIFVKMTCYCIKKLIISITRITEDLFSVCDDSVIVAPDLCLAQTKEFDLKITDDQNRSFTLSVPVNGKKTYSVKESGACFLNDGVYCLEVDVCGKTTDKIVYTPNLDCEIKNLVAKGVEDEFYRSLKTKYDIMEILGRNGQVVQAEKKYIELCRLLGQFGVNFGKEAWIRNALA